MKEILGKVDNNNKFPSKRFRQFKTAREIRGKKY